MAEKTKRILLVAHHNAFREALAMRLEQEEDLEVTWQAGSMADTFAAVIERGEGRGVDHLVHRRAEAHEGRQRRRGGEHPAMVGEGVGQGPEGGHPGQEVAEAEGPQHDQQRAILSGGNG